LASYKGLKIIVFCLWWFDTVGRTTIIPMYNVLTTVVLVATLLT